MAKPFKYKGYTIEPDIMTPLGIPYNVTRPEETRFFCGCWSQGQAKQMVDQDIRERACDHAKHGRKPAHSPKHEFCEGCGKYLLKPKPNAAASGRSDEPVT